jgi:hypothetical protein
MGRHTEIEDDGSIANVTMSNDEKPNGIRDAPPFAQNPAEIDRINSIARSQCPSMISSASIS